jgi:hypothetical protein
LLGVMAGTAGAVAVAASFCLSLFFRCAAAGVAVNASEPIKIATAERETNGLNRMTLLPFPRDAQVLLPANGLASVGRNDKTLVHSGLCRNQAERKLN